MAKERNHCSSLLSHIWKKLFSSQFSAIIQPSQILLHLCAFHKPQRISKLCYLILYICYLPSENLFFSSLLVSCSHCATSQAKIYFFSLLVSRSILWFFSNPHKGGTLGQAIKYFATLIDNECISSLRRNRFSLHTKK